MKELTLKDKRKIVAMLSQYYTIHPAAIAIINVAANNVGQAMDLTIKAFSIIGEPKNGVIFHSGKSTADDCSVATVIIDEISDGLALTQAIRKVTYRDIPECINLSNIIAKCSIEPETGNAMYTCEPFKIGPGAPITVEEWERIAKCNKDPKFEWHYEEAVFDIKQ